MAKFKVLPTDIHLYIGHSTVSINKIFSLLLVENLTISDFIDSFDYFRKELLIMNSPFSDTFFVVVVVY